ncbi:MAG: hypothetical protein RLZZ292_2041 [Bacteroidota bacterium]
MDLPKEVLEDSAEKICMIFFVFICPKLAGCSTEKERKLKQKKFKNSKFNKKTFKMIVCSLIFELR